VTGILRSTFKNPALQDSEIVSDYFQINQQTFQEWLLGGWRLKDV
jgi:hypothetical protein